MNQKKRTIKICHLRSSSGLYGAEAVILNISRELDRMGCSNHICCINNLKNPHAELMEEAQRQGIAASSVDSISLLDFEAVKEIRQKLTDGQFDVMHCHDYKASIYGLLASKGMDIRRVVTNHGWTRINFKLRVYEIIEGISYNIFDRIVAVSDTVKQKVRPFILHRSKIEVIENGVDFSAFGRKAYGLSHMAQSNKPLAISDKQSNKRSVFGLRDDDFVIGIVGRLSPEKGHEYLLKAFVKLWENRKGKGERRRSEKQNLPSVKLLIVGDGKLEDKLKALCEELGLSFVDLHEVFDRLSPVAHHQSVIFTGAQTDMQGIYQALDLFVMPSLEEGLPMALLEAMSSGVPVVATPVGQIPHLIRDGETGFLVEPGDVDGLADILGKMIEGRGVKGEGEDTMGEEGRAKGEDAMIANARTLVEEKYSSRIMAKKYLEVYEWLTE